MNKKKAEHQSKVNMKKNYGFGSERFRLNLYQDIGVPLIKTIELLKVNSHVSSRVPQFANCWSMIQENLESIHTFSRICSLLCKRQIKPNTVHQI